MSVLDNEIQEAVGLLCDPVSGLGEGTIRAYQKLTHAGATSGSPVSAYTILSFPAADAERGIKTGATMLVIDGKPFETAGVDLKDGSWLAKAAGGTGVDLELTGLVTGDPQVGYEVVINPKGGRSS